MEIGLSKLSFYSLPKLIVVHSYNILVCSLILNYSTVHFPSLLRDQI